MAKSRTACLRVMVTSVVMTIMLDRTRPTGAPPGYRLVPMRAFRLGAEDR